MKLEYTITPEAKIEKKSNAAPTCFIVPDVTRNNLTTNT